MENANNLICKYDDTKDDISNVLLDIYANFVQRELHDILSLK